MRLPAFTGDGKTCNDCGQPVEYDRLVAMHFHTEANAVCASGKRWADLIIQRGDGDLLEEPKDA